MNVSEVMTGVAAATLAALSLAAPARAADPVLLRPDPSGQSQLAAALGVGFQVFDMPELDVGILTTGNGDFESGTHLLPVGPVYSAAIGGQLGDTPFSLELGGALSQLKGSAEASQSFDGEGALFIAGPSNLLGGVIDLQIGTGPGGATARSEATISDASGLDAISLQTTASPPGGASALIGYSPLVPDGGGGAVTAVGTDGSAPSATAFGAVGNAETFALAAIGDLDGLSVRTDVNEIIDQGQFSVRLGRAVALADGWAVTPTIAPTYRRISRDIRSVTAFDVERGSAAADRLPEVRIDTDEELGANYYGGAIGATLSGPLSETVFFNVGGDFGLAKYDSDYSARTRARIADGRLDGAFDTVGFRGETQSEDDVTYFGSARIGMSVVQGRMAFSVGAQVEYLADVPTLSRNRYEDVTFDADSARATSGSGGSTSRLTSDDAWSYGGNVGLTFAF